MRNAKYGSKRLRLEREATLQSRRAWRGSYWPRLTGLCGNGQRFGGEVLVEPMGFEPTTFPVSPGRALRACQLLNEPPILLRFDVSLSAYCFASRCIFLRIN